MGRKYPSPDFEDIVVLTPTPRLYKEATRKLTLVRLFHGMLNYLKMTASSKDHLPESLLCS